LFFSRFLATTLPRQCFLCPLFFARLQVKGVTFHFLNDVLLLHLALEATQSVFERFAFLQSDFSQRNYTPKPVLLDLLVIARQTGKVKHYIGFLPSFYVLDVLQIEAKRELQLPWCKGALGPHEVSRNLIIRRIILVADMLGAVSQLRGVADGAIVGRPESAIQPLEKIERFRGELQLKPLA
jgi:hypothetical protein